MRKVRHQWRLILLDIHYCELCIDPLDSTAKLLCSIADADIYGIGMKLNFTVVCSVVNNQILKQLSGVNDIFSTSSS